MSFHCSLPWVLFCLILLQFCLLWFCWYLHGIAISILLFLTSFCHFSVDVFYKQHTSGFYFLNLIEECLSSSRHLNHSHLLILLIYLGLFLYLPFWGDFIYHKFLVFSPTSSIFYYYYYWINFHFILPSLMVLYTSNWLQ